MLNDINYFINNQEREILKEAIKEVSNEGIVIVCKKMDNTNNSFKEKLIINHNQKVININTEDSLFNKLALDRLYEVKVESI